MVILLLLAAFNVSIYAQDGIYNWYCVHAKEHKQPHIDSSIEFVEKYDGYYIDKKHGDLCEDKVVYLTFDAGYENGNVSKILDILKDEQVTGAFFILGNLVVRESSLVTRMFDDGHFVCNHTYYHKPMIGKSFEEFRNELEHLEASCLKETGHEMKKYYRPPEGKFDEKTLEYAQNLGYKTVFWSFAYADWDNNKQPNTEKAKQKILENIHNGEVILLHPTSSANAAVLRDVIKELKSQGYRFGNLDELCKKAE